MEEEVELPGWVHYHGPASPRLLADEVFPAARGLITLSQHAEGRPQVLLAAMAASLPIVASDMPAHASIRANGDTGLLCNDRKSVVSGKRGSCSVVHWGRRSFHQKKNKQELVK